MGVWLTFSQNIYQVCLLACYKGKCACEAKKEFETPVSFIKMFAIKFFKWNEINVACARLLFVAVVKTFLVAFSFIWNIFVRIFSLPPPSHNQVCACVCVLVICTITWKQFRTLIKHIFETFLLHNFLHCSKFSRHF